MEPHQDRPKPILTSTSTPPMLPCRLPVHPLGACLEEPIPLLPPSAHAPTPTFSKRLSTWFLSKGGPCQTSTQPVPSQCPLVVYRRTQTVPLIEGLIPLPTSIRTPKTPRRCRPPHSCGACQREDHANPHLHMDTYNTPLSYIGASTWCLSKKGSYHSSPPPEHPTYPTLVSDVPI